MKVFVTGGTGFLGRYVVAELRKRGHRVLILSRQSRRERGVKFVKGGIADVNKWKGKLKSFKPDAAIHLAWEGLPSQDFEVGMENLIGGLNCFRALGEAGCKTIVVAGSDQEYGHTGKKVKETSPVKPYNLLFSTKVAMYWLGSKIAQQSNMNFIWARIFFLYGAGQRSGALIPYLVSSLRSGGRPEIRNPYGANDFIYIEDAARALVMLATRTPKTPNEIYNIGSGTLTPTAKIIGAVYSLFGQPKPVFPKYDKRRPPAWTGVYADIGKIKKDYGWRPTVGLEKGIKKTVGELMK
jgi:nucleoside-diphosphate-sugar epimerase